MKKLYVNIEEIKIKGRPEILTNLVNDIGLRIQKLAASTEETKDVMYKFSASNQGKQYKNACDAVTQLSDQLYNASDNLYEMQCQIVKFENKCHRYEGDSHFAPNPRKPNIKRVKVAVNTSQVEFHKSEMTVVKNTLDKYSYSARGEYKKLRFNRDSMGRVWMDRQFKDFSVFIDEVCSFIERGCKEIDEYRNYLNVKINEMD